MGSASLDARRRAVDLDALESGSFDLLVIGGGITGAGVARDAAMRGLKVALVEARDWASGTSSRSSKMIHGGLRYLAQGDLALVKEAASERQVLRRIAPHLARLTPFVITLPNLATLAKMRAGLWTFEKLGEVPKNEVHEIWDLKEIARREPLIKTAGLHAALAYPEFLTDDARLTLANVRSAAEQGAAVASHLEITRILTEGGKAVGGLARSTLAGEDRVVTVRARLIVNAAGPWVDAVRALEDPGATPRLTLTKGVHMVLPRAVLPVNNTVILRAADKRGTFAVPHGPFTYLGTTDTFYPQADDWPRITRADLDYLVASAKGLLDAPDLKPEDAVAVWSGVRPLVGQAGKGASEISRKDEVWTGPAGVIAIAGGKLSAYRAMAERIVDQAVEVLGAKAAPCRTTEEPLPGAGGAEAASDDRLWRLYGAEAEGVRTAGGDAAAEATQAVQQEGALTLEDWWVRRTARAWFGGPEGLEAAADRMGELLGWSAERRVAELDHCRALDRMNHTALEAAA
jgi:glycerol-3-phosphate dehydrogenase